MWHVLVKKCIIQGSQQHAYLPMQEPSFYPSWHELVVSLLHKMAMVTLNIGNHFTQPSSPRDQLLQPHVLPSPMMVPEPLRE